MFSDGKLNISFEECLTSAVFIWYDILTLKIGFWIFFFVVVAETANISAHSELKVFVLLFHKSSNSLEPKYSSAWKL